MNYIEIIKEKILDEDALKRLLMVMSMKSKKIVFTNGCFDLLHPGHVEYLAKARSLGDILIVGVNSDESVRRLGKNENRPIQNEESRTLIIASLHVVNYVVMFNEDTPGEIIEKISPAVLVKGADYDANEADPKSKKFIVGSAFVRAQGGIVQTIELTPGFSTSNIEKKILGN